MKMDGEKDDNINDMDVHQTNQWVPSKVGPHFQEIQAKSIPSFLWPKHIKVHQNNKEKTFTIPDTLTIKKRPHG